MFPVATSLQNVFFLFWIVLSPVRDKRIIKQWIRFCPGTNILYMYIHAIISAWSHHTDQQKTHYSVHYKTRCWSSPWHFLNLSNMLFVHFLPRVQLFNSSVLDFSSTHLILSQCWYLNSEFMPDHCKIRKCMNWKQNHISAPNDSFKQKKKWEKHIKQQNSNWATACVTTASNVRGKLYVKVILCLYSFFIFPSFSSSWFSSFSSTILPSTLSSPLPSFLFFLHFTIKFVS